MRIEVGNFSSATEQQIFANWQPYQFSLFGPRTRYQLSLDGNRQVMQATSNKAVSGLMRALPIMLTEQSVRHWQWKITSLPTAADEQSKAGDDYSVRLYVIFKAPQAGLLGWVKNAAGLGETHALNYVLANQTATDSLYASPYTDSSILLAPAAVLPSWGNG